VELPLGPPLESTGLVYDVSGRRGRQSRPASFTFRQNGETVMLGPRPRTGIRCWPLHEQHGRLAAGGQGLSSGAAIPVRNAKTVAWTRSRHPSLLSTPADVRLHRSLAQESLLADLGVGHASGDQVQDLAFAVGESAQTCGVLFADGRRSSE
jgi:hypothetical protein